MKTKKEIEKELEIRKERIKQIWTFGSIGEVNYERGYIDRLRWVLENFKVLKANDCKIIWKHVLDSPKDLDFDRGCKEAIRWVLDP